MPALIDALSRMSVPDVRVPEELEVFGDSLLRAVNPPDLSDSALLSVAAERCAPEFVALAEAAARAGMSDAELLLSSAATALPTLTNLVFMDAADVALNCPWLLRTKGRDLALALYDRVDDLKVVNGLQAYSYLEALTRLGLVLDTARYRALEHFSTVSLDDSEQLLERLPKLMGIALSFWSDRSLREKLSMLLEHEIAWADAAYELAQEELRSALEAKTADEMLRRLTSARDQFSGVENLEEAREDAALYRSALDLTLAFVAGSHTQEEAAATETMLAAVRHRAAMATRSDLGGWATPRRQAEVEWYALARILGAATAPLSQPSWNNPGEALAQVLAAYRASRSITVMASNGLQLVLEPTVEAAFMRREGLMHHLAGLVAEGGLPENDLQVARELLEALSSQNPMHGGDAMGKAWAAAPELAAELGSELDPDTAVQLTDAAERSPRLVTALNEGAKARRRAKARESDPVVDRLLERVMSNLTSCRGLRGSAFEEFVELLTYLLKFAADRANIGRMNGGPDVHYLFASDDGPAFTEDFLQRDVATWLRATPLRRFVELEQHDVAAGRADITVTQTHKFTIEVKRERRDVSPPALLKAYGGQAAAYSVTGPAVSLEMVLDLTDQSQGTPSLEESVWVQAVPVAGAEPRDVVTIVIHGNRLTPRAMVAAS